MKLLEYLPDIIRSYEEIQQIMGAEQVAVDTLWDDLHRLMAEKYLDTCTRIGLELWESFLGITPEAGASLDVRKAAVRAKFWVSLPYTIETLKKYLDSVCGEGNYEIHEDNSNLTMEIYIGLSVSQDIYRNIAPVLEEMIPVNIKFTVGWRYNRHRDFKHMTHRQMAAYTHKELRTRQDIV